MTFLSLDYLYFSAPEIGRAVHFYTHVLGGTLDWLVRRFEGRFD
jgi:hypothetical protein